MRPLVLALAAALMSSCISIGHPHTTCPVGIAVPFVFIGINSCPNHPQPAF